MAKNADCACASPEDACLAFHAGDRTETVSPDDLATLVSETIVWTSRAQAECDPLFGGDDIGRYARDACLDREARKAEGLSETSKRLAGPLLERAAKHLAANPRDRGKRVRRPIPR
ncbi:MAG: hypothetical protein M5R36_08105 [Deltaproteobacteria bacterium]|nr:hypothetical protein [Deltaproteobacteria bacterium]